jgi:hypothetical protein
MPAIIFRSVACILPSSPNFAAKPVYRVTFSASYFRGLKFKSLSRDRLHLLRCFVVFLCVSRKVPPSRQWCSVRSSSAECVCPRVCFDLPAALHSYWCKFHLTFRIQLSDMSKKYELNDNPINYSYSGFETWRSRTWNVIPDRRDGMASIDCLLLINWCSC